MIATLRLVPIFIRRSPRQAFTAFALCATGVAVATLAAGTLIASLDGLSHREDRAEWREPVAVSASEATALARRSTEIFKGELIDVVEVSSTGSSASETSRIPVPPGVKSTPGPGEAVVSPALERMIARTPADMLKNRFGSIIGTITEDGLARPNELVALVGRSSRELRANATQSSQEAAGVRLPGRPSPLTPISSFSGTRMDLILQTYRELGLVAVVLVVVPAAMLVGSSAQLTAKRRSKRLAALRLAGATPWAVRSLAACETAIGALFGSVVGVSLVWLLGPQLKGVPIAGGAWFASDLELSFDRALGIAVTATAISVLVAVASLRQVAASPLSTARSSNPRTAKWQRVLVLFAAVVVMVAAAASASTGGSIVAMAAGLAVVMASLGLIGPWITSLIGRSLSALARRPSTLIGGRRISDDPSSSYRVVSAVVLAGLVAGFISAVVPTAAALDSKRTNDRTLSIVLPITDAVAVSRIATSMGLSVTRDSDGPGRAESQTQLLEIEPDADIAAERLRTATVKLRRGVPLTSESDDMWGDQTLIGDIGRGSNVVLVAALLLAAASSTVMAAASILDERRTLSRLVLIGVDQRTLHRSRTWQMMLPLLSATAGSVALGIGSGAVMVMGFGLKLTDLVGPSLTQLLSVMALAVAIGGLSSLVARPILKTVTRAPDLSAW